MYCVIIGGIVVVLLVMGICTIFSIAECGPAAIPFSAIFIGGAIYLGCQINKCDKARIRTLVETVPVIIVDDHAFIKRGSEMVNMSAYFEKNIFPEDWVKVFEWQEDGGWMTFDKKTEYELVTEKSN